MDCELMASGPIDSVLSHCFVWWAQHVFLRGADLFECSAPSFVTVV